MGQGNQVRRHQAWMIEFHLQSIPESNHPESGKRLKRPKWCASPQQFMMSHVAIGSVTDIAPPALPPKADIRTQSRDVRFVPKADMGPKPKRTKMCTKMTPGHSRGFRRIGHRNNIRQRRFRSDRRCPVCYRQGVNQWEQESCDVWFMRLPLVSRLPWF